LPTGRINTFSSKEIIDNHFKNFQKRAKTQELRYTQNPFEVNLTIVGVKILQDYK
jgi:hypothetical protein